MRGASALGLLANTFEQRQPAGGESGSELVRHEPECRVAERDERAAVDFLQTVLHVGNDRRRHEQRPCDLEQRRPFDRLHVSPEMAVVLGEIAEPSAARPRFDRQRQRLPSGVSFAGPICSSSAANVASGDARTWRSCV